MKACLTVRHAQTSLSQEKPEKDEISVNLIFFNDIIYKIFKPALILAPFSAGLYPPKGRMVERKLFVTNTLNLPFFLWIAKFRKICL